MYKNKLVLLTFISMSSVATSYSMHPTTDEKEFRADNIHKVTLHTDGGSIKIDSHDSDAIKVKRTFVKADQQKTLLQVNNDNLVMKSCNSPRGGYEVDYHLSLPLTKKVDMEIEGGKIKLESNKNFNNLSIKTGDIEADIKDSNCSFLFSTGGGRINLTYSAIPIHPVSVVGSSGNASLNIFLPQEATVSPHFNAPPGSNKRFQNDLTVDLSQPKFRFTYSTGSGSMFIKKMMGFL